MIIYSASQNHVAPAKAGAHHVSPLKPTGEIGTSLRLCDGEVLDDSLLIACATGAIRPTAIQRAGKPAMAIADFLRGKTIPIGTILI